MKSKKTKTERSSTLRLKHFNIFLKFIILLSFYSAVSFAYSYGAYGHHTLGSGRTIGLAGAYTALSEDSNSFLYNPAGTGFAEWTYHFEGATNVLSNDELDIDNNGVGHSQTQNLFLFGAHYKLKRFSVGLGQVQPYSSSLVNDFSTTQKSLHIKDTVLNFSYCPFDSLCLGTNAINSLATQNVKSSTEEVFQDESLINYKYGISLRKDQDYGIAYSVSPKYSWQFPQPKSNYFNSVIIPEKKTLGLFFSLKKHKSKVVFDWEQFSEPGDSVYAFESNEYTNLVLIKNKAVSIYRIGLEALLIERNKTTVAWRVGFYDEPSRIYSSLNRAHFTIGLEAKIGPAVLQVALDQARSFNNTSQSFSLLIDKL